MRIAVTSAGPQIDSPFVPVFGRCSYFVLVDTETLASESILNDAAGASGGAGIQAAQAIVAQRVEAVITGQVGPNAYRVLEAAGVQIYPFSGATVREAVESYRADQLRSVAAATVPGHEGLRMAANPGNAGPGTSPGRGPGGGLGHRFGGTGRGGTA